jgi:RNA ligase
VNYEFPLIKNIADVLPHIEGRGEFIIADKEGYRVINYNVMFEDTFLHPEEESISVDEKITRQIRRECRGLIFDSVTGDIIRRPYHKFKNVNEAPETQDHVVDLSRPHAILEKLDGSMICPFIVNGQMIWGTKMAAQDFHEMVKNFVDSSEIDYESFCRNVLDRRHTPIFEWMHPQKRIVIDYGKEPTLTLTAIRHMVTGQYVSLNGAP